MGLSWSIFDSAFEEAKMRTPNNFGMFERAWYSEGQFPIAFARRGMEDMFLVMKSQLMEGPVVYRFGQNKGLEIYVCDSESEMVRVFPFDDNNTLEVPLKYLRDVVLCGPKCDEGYSLEDSQDLGELERLTEAISSSSYLGMPDNSRLN